jgi:molybdopterin/thiamine biosynthesis adenylyltransferase
MPWPVRLWRRGQRRVAQSAAAKSGEPSGPPPPAETPPAPTEAPSLYARNWAYISPELQERLAATTLLTAGTGLGSVIAVLAARTGVQRFILADGDVVEESNLNRQAFTRAHLGQNKAAATAAIIADIQPAAQVEVIPRYLESADMADLVGRADIILNTIDLDTPAFVDLNRVARAAGKPVLFPLNPVWMGTVVVFTADSQSLDEFLGLERSEDPVAVGAVTLRLFERIYAQVSGGLPESLRGMIASYFDQDAAGGSSATRQLGAPQLGVTATLTASLAVYALVALVAKTPLRVAPQVITADAVALSA